MNRQTKRAELLRIKKMNTKELIEEMNIMHTKAYELAEKHYAEAMDILLTPRQKQAVMEKAVEIRELWDGIREVTIDTTREVS